MIMGDDQLGGGSGGRAPGKKRNRLWWESSQGFFFPGGGGFASVSRSCRKMDKKAQLDEIDSSDNEGCGFSNENLRRFTMEQRRSMHSRPPVCYATSRRVRL